MLLGRTVHILFSGSQLHKAAALATGAFAQEVALSADIQTAAILRIFGAFFLGHDGYQLGNILVYPVSVDIGEKAFFTEWSAHFTVTLTTEQGGNSAVRTPFSSFTLCSAMVSLSGASKSLQV